MDSELFKMQFKMDASFPEQEHLKLLQLIIFTNSENLLKEKQSMELILLLRLSSLFPEH
jgi:hypothetical protein